MLLIEEFNKNAIDFKISALDDIDTNEKLCLWINTIWGSFDAHDKFDTQELLDAYYRTAILMFNNTEFPYWKSKDPKEKDKVLYVNYYREKMNITITKDKHEIINQLIKLWIERKHSTIEWNLRGLESLARESFKGFNKNVISLIIDSLKPLIDKAESNLIRIMAKMAHDNLNL